MQERITAIGRKPSESIDPEEMRYNPKTKSVVWSSEGARYCKDFSVLQNPTVQTADLNGNYLNEYHLPVNLNMQKRKKDHAAMAFSKDYFR
jgi:hypothetical protein